MNSPPEGSTLLLTAVCLDRKPTCGTEAGNEAPCIDPPLQEHFKKLGIDVVGPPIARVRPIKLLGCRTPMGVVIVAGDANTMLQ